MRNWLMQIDESDAVTLQPLADSAGALEKVVAPGALIRGFRLLRERIPGYHCLSRAEELSILRTAYLDPEMIAGGLAAAEIWDKTALYTGMTYEELRELDATIRDWDDFERELRVLLDGVVGANRQRKHRRGKAILRLYKFMSIEVEDPRSPDTHLCPYFETMKRAYMKNRRTRGKAKKPESA